MLNARQQDKRAAACELLAPVYGWCTEGFDTADLQDRQGVAGRVGFTRRRSTRPRGCLTQSLLLGSP